MQDISGLPFWELHFDKTGRMVKHAGTIPSEITDLFIFAHAWNGDYTDAKDLYERFFETLAEAVVEHGSKPDVQIGLAGVFWPSMLLPEGDVKLEMTGEANFGPEGEPEEGNPALNDANLDECADVVGEHGLGDYLLTLPDALRVHLLGSTFGIRLVSAARKAAPNIVKSLTPMADLSQDDARSALAAASVI